MIMKNESKHLQRCLDSVKGLVNEIIIVDTGSTDDSIAIAERNGALVLHSPWADDFSIPRNIGIEKASGQWILILDPDEIIARKDHKALKELTRAKTIVAFQMVTLNYARDPRQVGFRTIKDKTDPLGGPGGFVPSTKTRFFKNGLGIKFEGCWHELADYYIARNKLRGLKIQIPIHHWGNEIKPNTIRDKVRLYLALGEKKVKEWPKSGQAWWELSVAEAIAGYRKRAIFSINKAMSLGFIGQPPLVCLARCHKMEGNPKKSALAFEKAVCCIYPNLTHINPQFKTLEKLTS